MARIELPVLSFLAVLSLFVILPLHLRSRNIPFLFVIAWLLVCNIIQGVDAIVWAHDASVRVEGWCDLVTLILYALRVALPAVALCVCRQLEIVSSTLDVSYDPRHKYFTSVFHYVMCLVIPVIYAILHVVVQDRRFVLVQEFGCQAAIYPSVPALFLTWFIPLVLCMITVFYAGLSFYNYHRRCSFFTQHLNPRSKITTAMFFRFVGFCLFVVLLAGFVTIFDMSSLTGESGLLEYTSWSAIHRNDLIFVVSKENRTRSAAGARVRTEVTWWMAPIASFVLCAVFASTKECWTSGREFCITAKERAIGVFTPKDKFDLPIQQLEGVTFVPLTTAPKAVHDPFKSGWDDTLKSAESLKKQTSFKPKVKVTPLTIPSRALKFPSPTCSSSSVEEDGDATFAASTQNYLLSPTGKEALGRVGIAIFSPMSQSAVDLDVHAESQQLIRKPDVSKVGTMKVGKHLRPPSFGVPATPETHASHVSLPGLTRPAPQDSPSTEVRPQPAAEPPVDRVVRSSKSRENLSTSAWPLPPTSIPLGSSPSPTRSPSRGMITPSPTLCPTPTTQGSNRNSYYDFVRQPSPTFAKATITNRDRAYIFGAPSLPDFTPPPPPRVPPPSESGSSRASWTRSAVIGKVEADMTSPSIGSFVESPSIYSTYSGNQPHPAGVMYTSSVKTRV